LSALSPSFLPSLLQPFPFSFQHCVTTPFGYAGFQHVGSFQQLVDIRDIQPWHFVAQAVVQPFHRGPANACPER
jgi:hypothetical protein